MQSVVRARERSSRVREYSGKDGRARSAPTSAEQACERLVEFDLPVLAVAALVSARPKIQLPSCTRAASLERSAANLSGKRAAHVGER